MSVIVPPNLLHYIQGSMAFTLPATAGGKTLSGASDVFVSVSSDFEKLRLVAPGRAAPEKKAGLYHLRRRGEFTKIYGKSPDYLEALRPSQEQIVHFCIHYPDSFNAEWGNVLFALFTKGDLPVGDLDDLFVAQVAVLVDRKLAVNPLRFTDMRKWSASQNYHFLLPTTAPNPGHPFIVPV